MRFNRFIVFIFIAVTPCLALAQGATGVIRAEEAVVIKSEVAGIIQRIAVEEGQDVHDGDLLVQMHSERQEIGVRLADARLLHAKAAVTASEVMLKAARNELGRIQKAEAALPRKELEDVSEEVHRLEALLEAQKADLDQAQVELELRRQELQETGLRAPFSGTVTSIMAHKGDTLRPLETQVLDLVNLNRLYVELSLPLEQIQKYEKGRQVRVRVEDEVLGKSGTVNGIISYVNPAGDPSSRTFAVKVSISDPASKIRPGMRAQVQLP